MASRGFAHLHPFKVVLVILVIDVAAHPVGQVEVCSARPVDVEILLHDGREHEGEHVREENGLHGDAPGGAHQPATARRLPMAPVTQGDVDAMVILGRGGLFRLRARRRAFERLGL